MKERMRVEIARTRTQILRAQRLIASVYHRDYGVVFSDDAFDLEAKIEPWPHAYLLGSVEDELVCCIGLYVRNTYVERFGRVTDEEIDEILREAGATPRFSGARKRELTKLTVRHGYRDRGYGAFILECASSRAFLQVDTAPDEPHVLVACAKRSLWESLNHARGVRTRPIKPFPFYKVHEAYRSEDDPMDSRVVIPELDLPASWYEREIPGEYEVEV